jgi:hypothetical protein
MTRMICERCPLSLVCWSGKLSVEPDDTYICPYCGNFFTKNMPLDGYTREAIAAGMTGFHCEKRPVTEDLRERWRVRRQLEMKDFALMVEDPAGFLKHLALKPCTFCRH